MNESKHSMLSASNAHRWLVCTPSAIAEQQEESECSVYAQEGTAAHELAELKLSKLYDKITEEQYLEKFRLFIESEYGQYYNKEFEEYVDEFVEYVTEQTKDLEDYHIYFELHVNFSNIVPQGRGTVDVAIIADDWIRVIDLKFGQGVPVSAINNPQLRLYGMGLLNMFPNADRVYMTIHQPRLASCDTEELSKQELVEWCINEVRPRADLAVEGKGIFQASEDACRFCKLRGKCKVRADNALALAQKEFEITEGPPIPQNLTPEQISNVLEIGPMFADWIKDVQAYALGQLIAGNKIPGYKLVEGRSNRIITDPEKVEEILLSVGLTEEMIYKPKEMLGISKLEAIVGKKLFADLCQDYLIKPQGKLSMAPESDKRPAVDTLSIAQSDFS